MFNHSNRRSSFLKEMGLTPLWVYKQPRQQPAQLGASLKPTDTTFYPRCANKNSTSFIQWETLKNNVQTCTQCPLCTQRHQTVFGIGHERADWLFIGEGPGYQENMQGEPFVGPAGKLLNNMLSALGLSRHGNHGNVYIANIVKCRPTDARGKDRPPSPEEIATCLPYLHQQIALIQPKILVALGKTAAITLLKKDPGTAVSNLRGKIHTHEGIPLIVTYHPAYLLRQLGDKGKAWQDLCLAKQVLDDQLQRAI